MCYTLEKSRNAFIVSCISSILLFIIAAKKGDSQLKSIALIFFFIGFMQLWDWFFWRYPKSSDENKLATKVAVIWNHLEPLVLAAVIYFVLKKDLKPVSKITIVAYTILILWYTLSNWSKLEGTFKSDKSGDSLDWRWNHFEYAGPIYALFLFALNILFYEHFTGWIKWFSIFIVTATFFFSYFKYQIKNSTGRFWCYFAAFAPVLYIIIDIFANNSSTKKFI